MFYFAGQEHRRPHLTPKWSAAIRINSFVCHFSQPVAILSKARFTLLGDVEKAIHEHCHQIVT